MNAYDQQPAPWTGQFAEREGRQTAENLVRTLRGQPTKPFYYKPLGVLCSIGGRQAVADIKGFQLAGFWAWFVWRGVYLFKMPNWSRRIKIGFNWAWDLLFARDLVYIQANVTERVSSSSYGRGDIIFRQGDPALEVYVIEDGEIEILRPQQNRAEPQVAAILRRGNFFGESALLEKRPHGAIARARTPSRVMVISSGLFMRLSRNWDTLGNIVFKARRERDRDPAQV